MILLPVKTTETENQAFINHPDCQETIYMSMDFFRRVGYHPPWIGYYMQENENIVGGGAFKGKPNNGIVEIAYFTVPRYRNTGIGTRICKELVNLALKTDPKIIIRARTMPEENFSTKILKNNNFKFLTVVNDEEDGEIWEWEYMDR